MGGEAQVNCGGIVFVGQKFIRHNQQEARGKQRGPKTGKTHPKQTKEPLRYYKRKNAPGAPVYRNTISSAFDPREGDGLDVIQQLFRGGAIVVEISLASVFPYHPEGGKDDRICNLDLHRGFQQ
ncbi:hypothetical protein LXL04_037650 [Taraxacum kok-saghyz]